MTSKEKPATEQREQKLVYYKESLGFAEKLLERYGEKIKENLSKDVDGWDETYTDYQRSIDHFLEQIPDDILNRYQAHGITRKDEIDRLAAVLNILANSSIKGWSGRLGGETGGYGAYKNADYLVISKLDKPLSIKNEKGETRFNEIGWEADIGAFVVDTKYYPLVEELKAMFPTTNIIKANELPKYFESKSTSGVG